MAAININRLSEFKIVKCRPELENIKVVKYLKIVIQGNYNKIYES